MDSFSVAERLVELVDGPESVQPEELLLQGADESIDPSIALGWRTKYALDGRPQARMPFSRMILSTRRIGVQLPRS